MMHGEMPQGRSGDRMGPPFLCARWIQGASLGIELHKTVSFVESSGRRIGLHDIEGQTIDLERPLRVLGRPIQ